MPPLNIIKHFYVFKNTQPRLQPCTIPLTMNQLCLEGTKEGLYIGIIIAVTWSMRPSTSQYQLKVDSATTPSISFHLGDSYADCN